MAISFQSAVHFEGCFLARPAIPWGRLQRKSNRDFAAGFRCLIPAAPAVPAAAAKQQNDKYDDEKRVGIHVELLLAVPLRVFALRVSTPATTTFLTPIRSYEMPGTGPWSF